MILETLSTVQPRICVPCCHGYIYSDNRKWWEERASRFPNELKACNSLVTDRIPPFPKTVRDALIDRYCPNELKSTVKSSEPDRDCLIRPYLGRRKYHSNPSRFKGFSLRNFPLHIDQIEALELDGALYARILAETLANLYWRAHIDANDMEIVLAPSLEDHASQIETDTQLAHPKTIISQILGRHAVWILDFDLCRHMSMNEEGVEQAVAAFYRNDPYYPRPGRVQIEDQILWTIFKDHFLETSEDILGSQSPEARLPTLWIKLTENKSKSIMQLCSVHR
ncbi:MAG: hypothetical protein LQ342_007348 [Letrouitia transgressa]|nr:MAG: hypothetical protein LQ342_007348 [Letrouitia transgressa]